MSYGQPPHGGGFGPPPGGAYGAPPGGGHPAPASPRTDALAIVSLVAGLLALVGAVGNIATVFFATTCGVCCPLCTIGPALVGVLVAIPAIAGLVTGILSYRRTTQQPESYTGKGMALGGAITSGISLAVTLVTAIAPMLGLGCLAAAGSYIDAGPRDPWAVTWDGGALPDAGPAFDPTVAPPSDPTAPPGPGAAGAPEDEGTACARVAACCRAYVAEMGGSCDAYNDVSNIPETMCQSAIAGYRQGLTVMNRTVPPECE